MNNYTRNIEKQNEELLEKLAANEAELVESRKKLMAPHKLMCEWIESDPELMWGWHCNIAMRIKDNAELSHQHVNEIAASLMHMLFEVNVTKLPHFKTLMKECAKQNALAKPKKVSSKRK
jgi:hypothetical protein